MIMAEPPRGSLSGQGPGRMIYVITCGMCGQSWQRATAHDGNSDAWAMKGRVYVRRISSCA